MPRTSNATHLECSQVPRTTRSTIGQLPTGPLEAVGQRPRDCPQNRCQPEFSNWVNRRGCNASSSCSGCSDSCSHKLGSTRLRSARCKGRPGAMHLECNDRSASHGSAESRRAVSGDCPQNRCQPEFSNWVNRRACNASSGCSGCSDSCNHQLGSDQRGAMHPKCNDRSVAHGSPRSRPEASGDCPQNRCKPEFSDWVNYRGCNTSSGCSGCSDSRSNQLGSGQPGAKVGQAARCHAPRMQRPVSFPRVRWKPSGSARGLSPEPVPA